jgi:hypothetical protein
MNNLKQKLEEALKTNKINYVFQYCGFNLDIIIHGADQIKEDISNWLVHDFSMYLVNKSIFYNFSGSFMIQDEKLKISVSFVGPNDEEFKYINLPLEVLFSDVSIKQAIENIISSTIKIDELSIDFEYSEKNGFKNFEISYVNEKKIIKLHKLLRNELISHIKDLIKTHVQNNAQFLSLPVDINQEYFATCDDNIINYSIITSNMIIEWDAIEN